MADGGRSVLNREIGSLPHLVGDAASGVSRSAVRGHAHTAIFVLFFVSGVPALLYQIVWQRSLFAIYGTNVESVTIVVTAFMLGLGLGSLAGGSLSRRAVSPIALFGAIELATAVYGLCSLELFRRVADRTAGAPILASGLLAFAMVVIPTLLMGATLPLLVSYAVRRVPNMGKSVGGLYFVNTLGSAAACFLAGGFLMRLLGQSGSIKVAAALNVTVGLGALLTYVLAGRADVPIAARTGALRMGWHLPFRTALIGAAASGFVALGYEMVWYRVFAFDLQSDPRGFAFLLGCYLAGLALGAFLTERLCSSGRSLRSCSRVAGRAVVAGNAVAFLVAPVLGLCVQRLGLLQGTALGFAMLGAGAALLGTTFPLLSHVAVPPDARAGSALSYLYLANILGSTAGTFLVGFVAMDVLSLRQVSFLLAAFGFALGFALLRAGHGGRLPRRDLLLVAGACAVVVGLAPLFRLTYERLWYRNHAAVVPFRDLVENRSGVVAVAQDLTVIGGGAYDGRVNVDPLHDTNGIHRLYALSALHPAPRDVLIIGLSSGSWAQVIANHPGVEKLAIVEIDPGYLRIIPHYEPVASVLHHPKVSVTIDDAHRWLLRNPDRKFDAIIMNTTLHWRAHATNLLSREFLELIRHHLKPGGVHYYNTTSSQEAQITGATVFPYAKRMWNFLALSDTPIHLDWDRWSRIMRDYRIDGRPVLERGSAAADQFAESFRRALRETGPDQQIEDGDSLRRRLQGTTVITEDNMASEWRYVPAGTR